MGADARTGEPVGHHAKVVSPVGTAIPVGAAPRCGRAGPADPVGSPARSPGPPSCDRRETWSARTVTDTPWMTRDKLAATWRPVPGLRARLAVRGTGAACPAAARRAGRPVRPAARLHRHRGVRPAPRRRHHLRAAPAAGRSAGRAAPVARHVPRVAGDPLGRGVPAADRRTRGSALPRPGRVRTVTTAGCRGRRRRPRRGFGGRVGPLALRAEQVEEEPRGRAVPLGLQVGGPAMRLPDEYDV